MDIPTKIYWIPANWELNDDAKPLFDLLEAAGMFHCQLESAARQLATVWDDLEGWWCSSVVESARFAFLSSYVSSPSDLVKRIESDLNGESRIAESGRCIQHADVECGDKVH